MTGAERWVLDGHRTFPEPFADVLGDRGAVISHHHHDRLAAKRLGGVNRPVEHSAAADLVQDLG
ncbi:hypothetical protein D3C83_292580 [compost metagenome]